MAEALSNFLKKITGRGLQLPNQPRPDIPQAKEIIDPEMALVLQVTPDKSSGADVVRVLKNKVILVDGVGNGASGDRMGAEKLATTLENTDGLLQSNGAYVGLVANTNSLALRARAGCFAVVYGVDKSTGLLKPKVLYAGSDLYPKEVYQEHSAQGARFACLLTDGGVDLFADPELFGDRPEYSRTARKVAERINYEEISMGDVPGAFTDILLRPLTAIINENPKSADLRATLNQRFTDFSAEMARYSNPPFTDDATLILTPLNT